MVHVEIQVAQAAGAYPITSSTTMGGGFNAAAVGATAAQRLVDGVASVPFEIVGFGFGASFVALFASRTPWCVCGSSKL